MGQVSDEMHATLDVSSREDLPTELSEDQVAVEHTLIDPNAFAVLYSKYVGDIYRYCYRRLGDREASEDVTSQIFMHAYAAMPSLGARPFRLWLFAIAHNAMIDHYRRSRPPETPLGAIHDLPDRAVSTEDLAIDEESATAIHRLFDQLGERDRHIVELRLAGLTGVEIAEALQCSHAVVRTAQHRAFTKIRALLADMETKGRPS